MQPRETVAIRNLSAKFVSQISAPVFFLAVALLPSLRVGIAAIPTPQEDVLSRPAAIGDRSLPASLAFEEALQVSGVPGGAALVEGCADEPKAMVHPDGATLRQVLDSIISGDSHHVWRMRKGVVNLEPVKGLPALLQTHLKKYDSGDLTDAVSAVSYLSSLPELARAAAKHGLTQNVLGPGLGGVAPGPPSPKKPLGVRLHDVTLLDALNAIARANEHGVWAYGETHCGSVHQFNISFAQ
jgi:hypothetical protein